METDHLFDLARRFDLRFGIMRDRWDTAKFPDRSIEDLKERYYSVCSTLTKVSQLISVDCDFYYLLITYDVENLRVNNTVYFTVLW